MTLWGIKGLGKGENDWFFTMRNDWIIRNEC